ncbi:MAG: transposase [Planctomycetaceae bacterium]|nr:transposase [Planctomycetaceae bacterium]
MQTERQDSVPPASDQIPPASDLVPPASCRQAGDLRMATPVPPASCRQAGGLRIRHRGHLPHWELSGSAYFVTFRLYDSIPRKIADAYRFERTNIVKTAEQLNRPLTDYEHERLTKLYSEQIEGYLDRGMGDCFLGQHSIARLVQNATEYFHQQRYCLYALCIMPNHVHVIVSPFESISLSDIVHSWKSYTSKQANAILKRSGAFCQREYYDHVIRNETDFRKITEYILNNPAKAGLADWRWVKMYPD